MQSFRDPDHPDIDRGLIHEYFPQTGEITLFVNSRHAGLNNGEDLTVAITRVPGNERP